MIVWPTNLIPLKTRILVNLEHWLSYIAREKLPPGKFGKKWSADALARPPKPRKDCTYRDELAYASALNELEKKTSHNELIDEQIAASSAATRFDVARPKEPKSTTIVFTCTFG